jgi:hypothetical protein
MEWVALLCKTVSRGHAGEDYGEVSTCQLGER